MNFFKRLFSFSKEEPQKEENSYEEINLPMDQLFVENFLGKNGKFLYCTSLEEVTVNIANILKENSWEKLLCSDSDLLKIIKTLPITITNNFSSELPFFVGCEHLIAENGSILFSSNQLKEIKICDFSNNFIVYATTSQLVHTKGESLTGIRTRYKGNIPSNISAIKYYNINSEDKDTVSFGNTNAKHLYLLLFEDL